MTKLIVDMKVDYDNAYINIESTDSEVIWCLHLPVEVKSRWKNNK